MKRQLIIGILVSCSMFWMSRSSAQSIVNGMRYSHCSILEHDTLVGIPPYSSNMPLDVFQTYFILDSLCRSPLSSDDSEIYDLITLYVNKEMIATIIKGLYSTINYDPVLFRWYCCNAKNINPQYKNDPIKFINGFRRWMNTFESSLMKDFLLFSDGIYEITLLNIVIDSSDGAIGSDRKRITCFKGEVNEVIKGGGLMRYCEQSQAVASNSSEPCLFFSYADSWITKMDSPLSDVIEYEYIGGSSGQDSLISPVLYGNRHHPVIGNKYLVFIELSNEIATDGGRLNFNLFPLGNYETNGGMFQINADLVDDHDRFFELAGSNTIGDVKSYIYDFIDKNFK